MGDVSGCRHERRRVVVDLMDIVIPIAAGTASTARNTTPSSIAPASHPAPKPHIHTLLLHQTPPRTLRAGLGGSGRRRRRRSTPTAQRILPRLPPSSELIKPQRSRAQMRPLVQPAFIAHDFARVERTPAPRRGLGGVAVETAATEVLGLFRRGVVGVLDRREMAVGCHGTHGHGRHAADAAGTGSHVRRLVLVVVLLVLDVRIVWRWIVG
jgi:hypothetical protein